MIQPLVTTRERRIRTLGLLICTAGAFFPVITMLAWGPTIYAVILFVIEFACIASFLVAMRSAQARAVALLRRVDFQICSVCHYDLAGANAVGTCPECGTSYKPAQLMEYWMSAYRMTPDTREA